MNGRFFSSTKGWQYTVYKVGELTTTTIWGDKATLDEMLKEEAQKKHSTGLYKFVVNSNSQIESVEAVLCDLHCQNSWTSVSGWDRSAVKAAISGNSFQTSGYTDRVLDKDNDNGYAVSGTNTAIKDYNVTEATKYIVVTKSSFTSDASLKEGSYADLLDGSIVLVNYSATTTDNAGVYELTAKTVYILKVVQDDINTPATKGSIHYTVNFYRYLDGKAVLSDTATYTSKDLTPGTYVYGYSADAAAAAGYTGAYTASWILSEVNANPAVWEVNYATPSVTVKAGQTAEVVLEVYPVGTIH